MVVDVAGRYQVVHVALVLSYGVGVLGYCLDRGVDVLLPGLFVDVNHELLGQTHQVFDVVFLQFELEPQHFLMKFCDLCEVLLDWCLGPVELIDVEDQAAVPELDVGTQSMMLEEPHVGLFYQVHHVCFHAQDHVGADFFEHLDVVTFLVEVVKNLKLIFNLAVDAFL